MPETVYIVHCIDAEGPLYEAPEVMFDRLNDLIKMDNLEYNSALVEAIRQGRLDLGGKETLVQKVLSSHLTNYMSTWDQLMGMLERATSSDFRLSKPDSFGGGWVYNWFCLDHVGYVNNPRRRSLGYHIIFDFYSALQKELHNTADGVHWHFHPMSTYRDAHHCATSLLNSPHIWESLARRIIERHDFPACCRCGFQSERPDINWFLEQYIPFDFTNTSTENQEELEEQGDLRQGRFGDWRLAPIDWGVYHPSHDYYQIPGQCRRYIARTLNLLNRFANIDQYEVDKAFSQAKSGKPTLLCVASHDFRDLVPEVEYFRSLLKEVSQRYPDVPFKYCEGSQAMIAVAHLGQKGPSLDLGLIVIQHDDGYPIEIRIETKQGKVFGPQPFLAIKTRSQRFIHDNLDFSPDLVTWNYVFDADSILPRDVESIGVGAADAYGNTSVIVQNF